MHYPSFFPPAWLHAVLRVDPFPELHCIFVQLRIPSLSSLGSPLPPRLDSMNTSIDTVHISHLILHSLVIQVRACAPKELLAAKQQ